MDSTSSTSNDGTATHANSCTETCAYRGTATGVNPDKLFQSGHRADWAGCSRTASVADGTDIPTGTIDTSAIGAVADAEAAANG